MDSVLSCVYPLMPPSVCPGVCGGVEVDEQLVQECGNYTVLIMSSCSLCVFLMDETGSVPKWLVNMH